MNLLKFFYSIYEGKHMKTYIETNEHNNGVFFL